MRVSRNQYAKRLSEDDLLDIADTLQQMAKLRSRLLRQLNGRVLVAWVAPLSSGGKAHRYYEKLRSALEEEWLAFATFDPAHVAYIAKTNPFFGEVWRAATEEKK